MPMIEVNSATTLERARRQIRDIETAPDLPAVMFWWTWALGYVAALYEAELIDEVTKKALGKEADAARDAGRVRLG